MRSSTPRRRTIGRPRLDAGIDVRGRLLDAAVTLFAAQGIAATTGTQIARHAGITPAMVHYYFKGRARLLDAVVSERLLRTVNAVWAPVLDQGEDAPAMVRDLARRIVKAHREQPWLASLWLREIVSEGGQLRQRLLSALPLPYLRHFIAAVGAAQRRHRVNARLEPRLVFMSVIALTLLPLATVRHWGRLPPLRGIGDDEIARHAEALLLEGLSVPGAARGHAA